MEGADDETKIKTCRNPISDNLISRALIGERSAGATEAAVTIKTERDSLCAESHSREIRNRKVCG